MISKKFNIDSAIRFYRDFEINEYYIFLSEMFTNTLILQDTLKQKTNFLEKTLFGKKITQDNVFFMIQNKQWNSGIVFDKYDDQVDMSDKNFYAVVSPENNDTGDYRVYKCLFNNYGLPSEIPPSYLDSNENQIYYTADGYIWKYLFFVSVVDFEKYSTLGYIPIISDQLFPPGPISQEIGSPIHELVVSNHSSNFGYFDVSIKIISNNAGVLVVKSNSDENLGKISDYYTGQTIYATNTSGESNTYIINTYEFNESTNEGFITLNDYHPDDILIPETTCKILPTIKIYGDGEGAKAIPVIENNRIVRTILTSNGSGYTNITAEVVDPFGFDPNALNSTDERALLRPIVTHWGNMNDRDHGLNLIDELYCNRILLYTKFNLVDNSVIPTTNSFAKMGIVQNPQFSSNTTPITFDNRLKININSTENLFVGEELTQVQDGSVVFTGYIHELDDSGNIYLAHYMGPYSKYANTDVSIIPDMPLFSSESRILNINTIDRSNYIQKTGIVYYVNEFDPIERTEDSGEEFKILLEF